MKALIVDTEELFRLSLKEVISIAGSFQEILEAGNEHEFLSKTANHDKVDLIVITPSQLGEDGAQWVHLVKRLYPSAAVVVFFNKDYPSILRNNLTGVELLPRDSSVAQTVTTIRRALKMPVDGLAAAHRSPATPNIEQALSKTRNNPAPESVIESPQLSRLSFRQRQILAMTADGLPNKEIAARLGIAEGTVKAHMHAIFKVMEVSNRTQAVIRYSSFGQTNANLEQKYATAF